MEDAIPAIDAAPPDVLLSDIALPGMSGVDGVRLLHQRHPALPVLILTVPGDDDVMFAAICAGACGYLLMETEPERLIGCIREVHEGGAPISPEIAREVVTNFRAVNRWPAEELDLSARQAEMLHLLDEGSSYKACAAQLGVSIDTIRFHARKIYERLHVDSRAEAVAKAFALRSMRPK
jgi:DNA-binding NarL/FixJ family response regulator